MEEPDRTYFRLENWFERFIYQNDIFFWLLVSLSLLSFYLDILNKVPTGTGTTTAFIINLYAAWWIYANARRRYLNFVRSAFYAILTLFIPWFGGAVYFIFRPKMSNRKTLTLRKTSLFPVPVGDSAFMLFRVPPRFLFKLIFWLMGATLIIIGFLSMLGKV